MVDFKNPSKRDTQIIIGRSLAIGIRDLLVVVLDRLQANLSEDPQRRTFELTAQISIVESFKDELINDITFADNEKK